MKKTMIAILGLFSLIVNAQSVTADSLLNATLKLRLMPRPGLSTYLSTNYSVFVAIVPLDNEKTVAELRKNQKKAIFWGTSNTDGFIKFQGELGKKYAVLNYNQYDYMTSGKNIAPSMQQAYKIYLKEKQTFYATEYMDKKTVSIDSKIFLNRYKRFCNSILNERCGAFEQEFTLSPLTGGELHFYDNESLAHCMLLSDDSLFVQSISTENNIINGYARIMLHVTLTKEKSPSGIELPKPVNYDGSPVVEEVVAYVSQPYSGLFVAIVPLDNEKTVAELYKNKKKVVAHGTVDAYGFFEFKGKENQKYAVLNEYQYEYMMRGNKIVPTVQQAYKIYLKEKQTYPTEYMDKKTVSIDSKIFLNRYKRFCKYKLDNANGGFEKTFSTTTNSAQKIVVGYYEAWDYQTIYDYYFLLNYIPMEIEMPH